MSQVSVVKYRNTPDIKTALMVVFERLEWVPVDEGWNIQWSMASAVKQLLGDGGYRLADNQLVNHFPNHYELTRKDLMYKNVKRHSRDSSFSASVVNSRGDVHLMDLVPATYSVASDLSLLSEEFRRRSGLWIVKPTNRSQGRGIFIIGKWSQLTRWLREKAAADDTNPFIVSRYVDPPLLIGGRKFDLRLYVLVLSYKPLVAYLHRQGFARFCSTKYSPANIDEDDLGCHITNVALQKHDAHYNSVHGGKWPLANVMLYLQGAFGHHTAQCFSDDVDFLVYQSLQAVQAVMQNDKHCFELYGYDVLVDAQVRPQLMEINASPSLTVTTDADRLLKEEVLFDAMQLITPPGFPEPSIPYAEYRTRVELHSVGGFRLLLPHTREGQGR